MNLKEKFTKCKNWVKEHKKVVIGPGVAIVAAGIGAVVLGKKRDDNSAEILSLDETDYGRNCTMKFVVDETQEVLGEVPCTELYAKESIDMQKEFENQ